MPAGQPIVPVDLQGTLDGGRRGRQTHGDEAHHLEGTSPEQGVRAGRLVAAAVEHRGPAALVDDDDGTQQALVGEMAQPVAHAVGPA